MIWWKLAKRVSWPTWSLLEMLRSAAESCSCSVLRWVDERSQVTAALSPKERSWLRIHWSAFSRLRHHPTNLSNLGKLHSVLLQCCSQFVRNLTNTASA